MQINADDPFSCCWYRASAFVRDADGLYWMLQRASPAEFENAASVGNRQHHTMSQIWTEFANTCYVFPKLPKGATLHFRWDFNRELGRLIELRSSRRCHCS